MTPTTRWPEIRCGRGVVASPHLLGSRAGRDVLARGGNAVDAAIAAAATIAVVYPHMNGIGGDNFWLIFDGERDALLALNGAGRSAAAADLAAYARFGATIPTRGGAAALTVPGAVSGWWQAHTYSRDRLKSTMPWAALLSDAIGHARDGFAPSASQRRNTEGAAAALFATAAADEVKRTLWPTYHPDRLATDRFVQGDLAATLAIIAEEGADAFYDGALARRIARGAEAAGSPLRLADLQAHRADWVEPLRVPYRSGEAASFPPPTQGFAALAILALLEGFDVGALDDADHVHLVVEATKLAFEDRDRYLTDPTVEDVPVARCRPTDRRPAATRSPS